MTPPLPRRPRWRSLALLALCLAPLLWPLEHLAERYYRSELAGQNRQTLDPVSYTHLTLPTIYSV